MLLPVKHLGQSGGSAERSDPFQVHEPRYCVSVALSSLSGADAVTFDLNLTRRHRSTQHSSNACQPPRSQRDSHFRYLRSDLDGIWELWLAAGHTSLSCSASGTVASGPRLRILSTDFDLRGYTASITTCR